MSIEIIPTGAPVGAQVRGVELDKRQPGEVIHALIEAFHEHHVLVWRDQQLTPERQLDVGGWFGPRFVPPSDLPVLGDEDQPPVVPVSNVAEGGVLGHGKVAAHSDLQYMPEPLAASMLFAIEVPATGGVTEWSNLHQAYDELSPADKTQLTGVQMWGFNPYAGRYALEKVAGPNQKYVDTEVPRFLHPLVRTHPVTGRKALYVSYLSGGLVDANGADLPLEELQRLQRHVDQDHLYYTHDWRPGDVVLWDNRCTNHRRSAFPATDRRLLHRVQIAGGRPF